MVKETKKSGKVYFICEECGLIYSERGWAEKCQDWCAKNKTCNLEITKHAIREIGFST
jgi:hypothetical protein